MRLDEAGEFGLLAELERRGLAQGIEHDAAQIEGLVVTQDALVEGVHFRFDLVSWRDLGFRAMAVNLSDLAACGADPLALIVTVGLPGESQVPDVVELYEGLNEAGVPVRGGDTTRAQSVLLSVTALGRADRVPVARLNIDDYPEIASRYEIFSIPTVMLFAEGAPRGRLVGVRPLAHFEAWLGEVLPAGELDGLAVQSHDDA